MAEELTRVYTIPLRRAKIKPRIKRANAAVRIIREYLMRHMKATEVKIENNINESVWERGIHTIPSRVKVKATRKDGIVRAELA
ncbi:MAG: 50S ribosomal protein L31e [Candidatus Aenigmarchaeota archaeon]|nr:50S ribosomal protein L31e [Candidatus Aenigmarchaeota archaeon]